MSLTKVSYSMITGASVNIKDFGAVGDGVTDDTAAIQAAINTGSPLFWPAGNYKVTTLTANVETVWFFDNAQLIAGATTATTCLIKFGGVHCKIYNMKLNGNFNLNYTCMLWWYNDAASSQHNDFYDLEIRYAKQAIIYGELPGQSSTGFAQSENTLFGFHTRGIERVLYMNHSNGLLFCESCMLVANNEEWAANSPGNYDNTTNRCFEAFAGVLVINGGELQNSIAAVTAIFATIQGGTVFINEVTTEVDVPIEVSGQLYINGGRILNTQSLTDQFYVAPSANNTTKIWVRGTKIFRPLNTGNFSNKQLVNNTGSAGTIEITFQDCDISEWSTSQPIVAANMQAVRFIDCRLYPDGTLNEYYNSYLLNTNGQNIIEQSGRDLIGYTTDGWYSFIVFGAGATALSANVPNTSFANSLSRTATGKSGISTIDGTSLATVKATGVPVGFYTSFLIECWVRVTDTGSGTSAAIGLVGYDSTGAYSDTAVCFDNNNGYITTTFKYLRRTIQIPNGSAFAYVGFGGFATTAKIEFCGMKVRRANWNVT